MPIAPSSWSGPSAAIVAGWIRSRISATSPGTANDVPWLNIVIGRCSAGAATPYGTVGVVDEQMHVRLADQSQEIGNVAAARALHVVGVDGPPGDGRDGVLELGRLVEPVGVERHGHVVTVGVAQRVIDDVRVRAVVLVDLEPASRRRRRRASSGASSSARALACSPTLTGHRSSPARIASIAHGGSSNPALISVVTPPDSAAGSSAGLIVWTWLSTAPGVAIRP